MVANITSFYSNTRSVVTTKQTTHSVLRSDSEVQFTVR